MIFIDKSLAISISLHGQRWNTFSFYSFGRRFLTMRICFGLSTHSIVIVDPSPPRVAGPLLPLGLEVEVGLVLLFPAAEELLSAALLELSEALSEATVFFDEFL